MAGPKFCISVFFFSFVLLFQAGCGTDLRQLTDPFLHLESPHWDPVQGFLYMVDRVLGLVIKFDPKSGNTTQVYLGGGELGPILTVEGSNNTFVAGRGRDLIKFQWDGMNGPAQNITILTTVEPDNPSNAFYTGKADSSGRIWVGTYATDGSKNKAGLYLIEPKRNFSVTKKLDVSKSNGMEWNANDDQFFYIDTPTSNVDLFSYNSSTGEIGNRDAFYNTENTTYFGQPSIPGGMTLDNLGNLYLATSTKTAGYVATIDGTNGQLLSFSSLNPKLITSLAWGGEALDVLYVTTSRLGLSDNDLIFWRGSGALFSFANSDLSGPAPNKVQLH